MADVAGVRPIELLTIWIGARKCRISFLSWRHRYHGGPPLIGNGPEDTDSTPVVPCYYSPGLPVFPEAFVSSPPRICSRDSRLSSPGRCRRDHADGRQPGD